MKTARLLALAALLAILLSLSACTGGAGGGGAATAPPAARTSGAGQQTTPPTVKLTQPLSGATVPAGDLTVKIDTTGLEFVMPSNTNVSGQGHVHFTLDDKPFQMSTKPEYVFKDVASGPHRLKAELVQNNTESFDPPVEQEIEFNVQ